jgi:adenylate cyclase
MLARLPALNDRWQSKVGERFGVGIGVNSGPARVGNTGSQRKFKYGPLGNTVNLASRVQGATKHVRTRLLVTRQTRERLGSEFTVRRLCDVRVVNIAEPVGLYELSPPDLVGAEELRTGYERGLALLEEGRVSEGVRTLGALVAAFPEDGPAQVLLARALDAAGRTPPTFTKVWELPGK